MHMHVPKTGNQVLSTPVDSLRTPRNSRLIAGRDLGENTVFDHDGLVFAHHRFPRLDDRHVFDHDRSA